MVQTSSVENPVVKQPEKVIIPNKHGEKLVGLLHETGSKEIVILCHGLRATKGDKSMVNICTALEKEGISAFRFDFAGNGESEGSFGYGNFYREADDLHSVIQHYRGANRVVAAILGHSKGGDVVLLYASKYHDIPRVINVSGRYRLNQGIEERFGEEIMEKIKKDGYFDVKNKSGGIEYRVTEEGLLERINTDMHEACLKIDEKCRVLTIHGTADKIISVQDAYEFAKIIPNHRLQVVKGANHGYTSSKHQNELASIVLNYMKAAIEEDKVAF